MLAILCTTLIVFSNLVFLYLNVAYSGRPLPEGFQRKEGHAVGASIGFALGMLLLWGAGLFG